MAQFFDCESNSFCHEIGLCKGVTEPFAAAAVAVVGIVAGYWIAAVAVVVSAAEVSPPEMALLA